MFSLGGINSETLCFLMNSFCFLSFEGIPREPLSSLEEARTRCRAQLDAMRPDHLRGLNPTPYKVVIHIYVCVCVCVMCVPFSVCIIINNKDTLCTQVSVTGKLYDYIHRLWLSEAPIGELW